MILHWFHTQTRAKCDSKSKLKVLPRRIEPDVSDGKCVLFLKQTWSLIKISLAYHDLTNIFFLLHIHLINKSTDYFITEVEVLSEM